MVEVQGEPVSKDPMSGKPLGSMTSENMNSETRFYVLVLSTLDPHVPHQAHFQASHIFFENSQDGR